MPINQIKNHGEGLNSIAANPLMSLLVLQLAMLTGCAAQQVVENTAKTTENAKAEVGTKTASGVLGFWNQTKLKCGPILVDANAKNVTPISSLESEGIEVKEFDFSRERILSNGSREQCQFVRGTDPQFGEFIAMDYFKFDVSGKVIDRLHIVAPKEEKRLIAAAHTPLDDEGSVLWMGVRPSSPVAPARPSASCVVTGQEFGAEGIPNQWGEELTAKDCDEAVINLYAKLLELIEGKKDPVKVAVKSQLTLKDTKVQESKSEKPALEKIRVEGAPILLSPGDNLEEVARLTKLLVQSCTAIMQDPGVRRVGRSPRTLQRISPENQDLEMCQCETGMDRNLGVEAARCTYKRWRPWEPATLVSEREVMILKGGDGAMTLDDQRDVVERKEVLRDPSLRQEPTKRRNHMRLNIQSDASAFGQQQCGIAQFSEGFTPPQSRLWPARQWNYKTEFGFRSDLCRKSLKIPYRDLWSFASIFNLQ